jgi:hypothetical protein
MENFIYFPSRKKGRLTPVQQECAEQNPRALCSYLEKIASCYYDNLNKSAAAARKRHTKRNIPRAQNSGDKVLSITDGAGQT